MKTTDQTRTTVKIGLPDKPGMYSMTDAPSSIWLGRKFLICSQQEIPGDGDHLIVKDLAVVEVRPLQLLVPPYADQSYP